MNVSRRILCVFALVTAFALAGCGGGSTTSSTSTDGPREVDKKGKKKGLEMPPKVD
jgi:ABC-type glycerol-3-phosphate transport system substrate-binding protein